MTCGFFKSTKTFCIDSIAVLGWIDFLLVFDGFGYLYIANGKSGGVPVRIFEKVCVFFNEFLKQNYFLFGYS